MMLHSLSTEFDSDNSYGINSIRQRRFRLLPFSADSRLRAAGVT